MRLLTAGLIMFLAAPAIAHVAPSEDANNRYLKLTPTADRVRLSYTVFMGQRPGARERARLDRNRDGVISDAEGAVFRDRLAEEVRGALEVTIDGQRVLLTWAQSHLGLGTPATAAGAFSVDLVAWLCFPVAGGRHTLVLRDRFRLADPGDTEVRVEESPGVTVTRSVLSGTTQSLLDFKWVGGATYLHQGLEVDLEVGADAPPADAACAAGTAPTSAGRSRRAWWVGLGIGAAGVVIALALWRRRASRG